MFAFRVHYETERGKNTQDVQCMYPEQAMKKVRATHAYDDFCIINKVKRLKDNGSTTDQ